MPTSGRVGVRWHRLLALIPAAALLGSPWISDRLEPELHGKLQGMPLLLTYIVAWVLLATITMGVIGWLDGRAERGH